MSSGLNFLEELDKFAGIDRKWIQLKTVETNPNYGKYPGERTFKELLELGVINLDKPPGPTSHEVTAWIKEMLGVKKAGHAGTLELA